MNRLILVGNGFDLAHGLKTSYKDFIDDFWENQEIEYFKFKNEYSQYNNDYYTAFNNTYFSFEINPNNNFGKFLNSIKANGLDIQFKNKFLQIISEKINEVNWVDIENEYYQELKVFDDLNIDQLNRNFEKVKELLGIYLSKIEKDFIINSQISKHILNSIYLKDLESLTKNIFIEKIFNECIIEEDNLISYLKSFKKEVLRYKESSPQSRDNYFNKEFDKYDTEYKRIFKEIIFPKNTLLLNFNYTNTTFHYINECNRIKYNNIDNTRSALLN